MALIVFLASLLNIQQDSVENMPAGALVVSLGKALNEIASPFSSRQ